MAILSRVVGRWLRVVFGWGLPWLLIHSGNSLVRRYWVRSPINTGEKKTLIVSLMATFFTYLLTVAAIELNVLWLLIVSRT